MSSRRFIKQMFYAGVLAVVFLGVVTGLVFFFVAPPSINFVFQTPVPTLIYSALNVERTDYVQHGATVDIVSRIHNPNAHAGVGNLAVTFLISGPDNAAMKEVTVQSYVLPGSTQNVSALDVPFTGAVSQIQVKLPDRITFAQLPENLRLPTFSTFLYNRADVQPGTTILEQQRGIVTNTSTFDFNRVEVTILAFDKDDKLVGVGTTFMGALNVQEQREFTVLWEKPQSQVDRVIAAPTTNIFQEDNIIQAIGNPSLLR